MANLPDIGVGALPNDPDKKIEAIVKQVNEQNRLISNEDRTKIIKDDAGDARVLLGYQLDGFDNGDVGLKVSQEGVDVQGASDDNLIFSTDFNLFKIVEKGTSTVPSFSIATGGSSIVTIPHNQSFTPLVKVYVQASMLNWATSTVLSSDYVPIPLVQAGDLSGYFFFAANGNGYPISVSYIVDDTNIYIQAVYTSSAATTINDIPVVYYILRETAS